MKARLVVTVKQGIHTLSINIGLEKEISKEDLENVVEVEHYLERITGLRFHIQEHGVWAEVGTA